jgi:hypothetical protein
MTVHLTARLVWHDRAWDGHVCDHPSKNVYCVAHQHVREVFRDPAKVEREDKAATLPLVELDGWRPPCSRDPVGLLQDRCHDDTRRPAGAEGTAAGFGGLASLFRLSLAVPLDAGGQFPVSLRAGRTHDLWPEEPEKRKRLGVRTRPAEGAALALLGQVGEEAVVGLLLLQGRPSVRREAATHPDRGQPHFGGRQPTLLRLGGKESDRAVSHLVPPHHPRLREPRRPAPVPGIPA